MVSRFIRKSVRVPFLSIAALLVSGAATNAQAGSEALAAVLKDRVTQVAEPGQLVAEYEAIKQFYEARGFAPVWYDEQGMTRAAALLAAEFAQAESWGLKREDFALSKLATSEGPRTRQDAVAADLELSKAILKYARQASGGRIDNPEQRLSDFIDRRAQLPAPSQVLPSVAGAADAAAALRAYHPQHPQFQKLHDLYVKLAPSAGEPKPNIAPEGPMLYRGARGPEIAALRQHLGVLADDAGSADLYDEDLQAAVKAFQKANKLSADGLVGPRTRKALQDADGDTGKLQAIVASMEQWRWMPRDLGKRYALVNIPAYEINFVEDGKTALTERVIVGKPQTPTPVFSKAMTSIVLKPSWSLPDSIKREKLLSAARRGGSLEGEGLIVKKGSRTVKSWDVDWSTANLSHYKIYQPSGDGNALGNVKFLFPNKFSVYLHDTPNKSLFEASDRAYSHGCIRLRNPLAVAQFIADWDQGEDEINVKKLASRGPDNNEITLQSPLPIHVGYFTAWVNEEGEAEFYDDIYQHVPRVQLALAGKWNAIDRGPIHDMSSNPGLFATNLKEDNSSARPAKRVRLANDTVLGENGDAGVTMINAAPMGLLSVPSPKFKSAPASIFAPAKPNAVSAASAPKSKSKTGGYVGDIMSNAFLR